MIVGIAGPSFCGSTLVNCMFGAMPGITAMGETHWIVDEQRECLAHGDACPTWPTARLCELREGGLTYNWFRRLESVASGALVVSDKNAKRWQTLGLPDVAVLPYKAPSAMLDSYVRRGEDVAHATAVLIAEWDLLRSCLASIPKVAVSIEALALDPSLFARICSCVGVTYHSSALEPWRDQCFFGGNPAWRSGFGYKITAPQAALDLPEAQGLEPIYAWLAGLALCAG